MSATPFRWVMLLLLCGGIARAAVLARQQAGVEMDEGTRARLVQLETDLDATLVQLETDLDAALVSANDPASLWLRGLLTRTNDEARARDLAAAHRAAPNDILYLASLASACQVDLVPRPAGCAESDWVAKWASVDPDNAAPWVLLAARSVRIRQPERAVADMVQASQRARYDEYWNRGAARAWGVVRSSLPSRRDDATGALMVWSTQPLAATAAFEALCERGPVEASAEGREACLHLATGTMSRADTALARRAAAGVVEFLASDAAQKSRARKELDDLTVRARACSDWVLNQLSPQAAAGGASRVERWIAALDKDDELTACDRQGR